MTQLENRTLLLVRPETTYGVDAIQPNLSGSPSPLVTDAMLCSDFDIKTNASLLERANYNASLSHDNTGVGRMLAQVTFKAEFRASGTLGTAPRLGRLLKACGMQETTIANTAAATIGTAVQGPNNTSNSMTTLATTFTKTTAPTSRFDSYRLTATVAGAPATAKLILTGAGFPELDPLVMPSTSHTFATNSLLGVVTVTGTIPAPVFTFTGTWVVGDFVEIFVGGVRFYYQIASGDTTTTIASALLALVQADARFTSSTSSTNAITGVLSTGAANAPGAGDFLTSASGQAVTLGSSGAVVTLPATFGGTGLVVGEYFDIPLRRPGVRYDPVSDLFSSVTIYAYLDGSLYKSTGARGTFSCDGTASQFALMSFTFTGLYNDPVDAALPTGVVFEASKPAKVELSQFAVFGQLNARASKFAFDIANTVTPNDNINATEGYDEVRITDRLPTCSADPESVKPSVYNPWARMRRADATRFHVAVGIRFGAGNIARFQADNVNYTASDFANRNKVRAYGYNFRCARVSGDGNDEMFLHFG